MTSHAAATQLCELCGGPCREPFRLPPIHPRYPFLSPEQIAMTHPPVEQPEAPADEPVAARGRRLGETTAKRPSEDRAFHGPSEDRSA